MRVIIDTDTAGDDCFSMLLALAYPGVSVEAITICGGNIAFEQQIENALYTLEVAGKGGKVPVYAGCQRPMMRKPVDAEYVFGKDGMSDANYPRAHQRAETTHAVQALIDIVMANPGEITILAQAPLTNIAAAVVQEPRFAAAVKHLWIMGGTDNSLGNVTPAAEFNFYVDPEAAQIVMNAGFACTLSTWTLSVQDSVLYADELAALDAIGTPLAKFFTQVNKASVEFSLARYGQGDSLHPDSLTCALMLDESLILAAGDCVVDVETQGRLTRGYSSVSSPRLPAQEEADPDLGKADAPNARVIRRADRAGFLAMLQRTLAA
ncbi:purine nucleosidase [Ketogulonicigenium robustum]|uniref:Purine nucleosidase n=1 Tax=Ketogulonicigenium robustum TaxID=92947 RepID=A0A1W6P1G4_9RHOB|nr:nucleoside hydrolase [Ketogulonicigenium robustum]ARO15358.1 purine nucleosidase [Ketogulonicigenium robustum]